MARRKRNYTVRTGDTASTIAKQLGIDPQTLMRANTGVSNLRAGMVIRQPPTPPAQPPGGGGGMYWGQGVYDAVQGAVQNVGNWWDQGAQWRQNAWQGAIPRLPTNGWGNIDDFWTRPRGPAQVPLARGIQDRPYNPNDFGASLGRVLKQPAGDIFREGGQWLLGPNKYIPESVLKPTRGLFGFDTPHAYNRQAYQGYDGSYVDAYGRRVSSDVDPRDLQAGRYRGYSPTQAPTGPTQYNVQGIQSQFGQNVNTGVGGGGGFQRDQYGRIALSKDQFDLIHNYAGGNEAVKELAAAARQSPGGVIRVAGEGGSLEAIDGAYNMKVRTGPTGNVTYTPVSGATARSMSRPKSLGRRQARMRYVKSGGDSGWNTRDYNRRRTDDTQSTSGRPVGTAARYQSGYNFDYDTQGGYMPMVRQKARPGYLGLINWRI